VLLLASALWPLGFATGIVLVLKGAKLGRFGESMLNVGIVMLLLSVFSACSWLVSWSLYLAS
jgi:hypothetical protein